MINQSSMSKVYNRWLIRWLSFRWKTFIYIRSCSPSKAACSHQQWNQNETKCSSFSKSKSTTCTKIWNSLIDRILCTKQTSQMFSFSRRSFFAVSGFIDLKAFGPILHNFYKTLHNKVHQLFSSFKFFFHNTFMFAITKKS